MRLTKGLDKVNRYLATPRGTDAERAPAWFPPRANLIASAGALYYWSQRFELPDPVDYKDFRSQADLTVELIARSDVVSEAGPLLAFPWPKPSGAIRVLSVPSPLDLILLRAAAGPIAQVAHARLSNFAYASRLGADPPDWRFQRGGFRKFQREAIQRAMNWDWKVAFRTDIIDYYGSIPVDKLLRVLWEAGAPPAETAFVLDRIMAWQDRDALRGIPIGPEPSGILGGMYLLPVDTEMLAMALGYFRYTDDIVLLLNTKNELDQFDEGLDALDLRRSSAKTQEYDNPWDLFDAIWDLELEYLGRELGARRDTALEQVDELLVEVLDNGIANRPHSFRWVLKTLTNSRRTFALPFVTGIPELMQQEPQLVGNYLACFNIADPELHAFLMDQAAQAPMPSALGAKLHALRVLSTRRFGEVERHVFEAIQSNDSEHPIVRSWALMAEAACDGFRPGRASMQLCLSKTRRFFGRASLLLRVAQGPSTPRP